MQLAFNVTVTEDDGWIIAANPETEALLKRMDNYDDGTGNFNSGVGNVCFMDGVDMLVKIGQLVQLSKE